MHHCSLTHNCLLEALLFDYRTKPFFLKFLLIFMLYAYSTVATKHNCLKSAHRLFKKMYIHCSTVGSPHKPLQCRVRGIALSLANFGLRVCMCGLQE